MKNFLAILPLLLGVIFLSPLNAADPPKQPARLVTKLPEDHAFQKTLRNYLGSLTEKDYDHGVTEKFNPVADPPDQELQFRHWLLSKSIQPLIGTKRGYPSVNAPAKLFTLKEIEKPEGVMMPPAWPEGIVWLTGWDYPGNPYHKSRAMKLRAFTVMCIHLTMLDDQLENAPEEGGNRFDSLSAYMIRLTYPYLSVKDVLPEEARKAYEAGLRKMGRRLLDWGTRAQEPEIDLVAPVSLWYLSQILADPAFTKEVEAVARKMFTEHRFFSKAGYYIEHGGIDVGYAGTAHIFTTWAALASNWPFAKEALDRAYRLRGHLYLPDPDGKLFGPCHFNARTGFDASRDQWAWDNFRELAASLVTPEAAHLAKMPTTEELLNAGANRARACQAQLNENPVNVAKKEFFKSDQLTSNPWKYRQWLSYNFPLSVNYAYDFCPKDAYAQRLKLEKEVSPFLKSPWDREATFLRAFDNDFVAAKQPTYRAILHTGPVGGEPESDHTFSSFAGFGGGQLSSFWTPATGSVILGRRGGMTRDKNFDLIEEWRQWAIHAISGTKPDGKVFTTARIRQPAVLNQLEKERGTIRVSGVIPAAMLDQKKVLVGRLEYARAFTFEEGSIKVESTLRSTGQDTIAELYETIPVFLRDTQMQPKATPTAIEFRIGDAWKPASEIWFEGVTAVRLTRFDGAVEIVFEQPRRVKLSPAEWVDTYLSRIACRNVLIDLLENKDKPKVLREAAVSYRVMAGKK
ncbi:MAG: hypothetical protein K8T89_18300 [Planctomycetes bacterium]|nr:hypothetical protein [Planctomycetota bacterium]